MIRLGFQLRHKYHVSLTNYRLKSFSRSFCYATTTFGNDFEQCGKSALLRCLYGHASRGEGDEPNIALVLVDKRYLTEGKLPVNEIVPILRRSAFGWPEMSFCGAVIDSSPFSLPSVSVMLVTSDECAFTTVKRSERDDDVSVGRWHRPYNSKKAREQFSRQLDAYFMRRELENKPFILGERTWFKFVYFLKSLQYPSERSLSIGRDEVALTKYIESIKASSNNLNLIGLGAGTSQEIDRSTLTVAELKEQLPPYAIDEIEETIVGFKPSKDHQEKAAFALSFGEESFLKSKWLKDAYPNARKFGLAIARTPFITGTPCTYFIDDQVYSSGGFVLAFETIKPFKHLGAPFLTEDHFCLEKVPNLPEEFHIAEAKGNIIIKLDDDGSNKIFKAMMNLTKDETFPTDPTYYAKLQNGLSCRILSGVPETGRIALDTSVDLHEGDKFSLYYLDTTDLPKGKDIPDMGVVFTTTSEGLDWPKEDLIAGDRPGLFYANTEEQGVLISKGTATSTAYCDAVGSVYCVPISGSHNYPVEEPEVQLELPLTKAKQIAKQIGTLIINKDSKKINEKIEPPSEESSSNLKSSDVSKVEQEVKIVSISKSKRAQADLKPKTKSS